HSERRPRSGSDRIESPDLGGARPRRSHPRQDRSHDGGAGGARPPPEGKPDSAGGAGDPPKGGGLLRDRAAVRIWFLPPGEAHHSLALLCRCLRVTRSGFHAWQKRPESAHAKRDTQLKVLVRASFEGSNGRYGSPRIHKDLQEQKEPVSRKRVVRLMQEEKLK